MTLNSEVREEDQGTSVRFLRAPEVARLTGVSRTTLWRLEKRGEFPQRRRIAPGAVGWLADEVTEWLRSRPLAVPDEEAAP